jgi:hypothetical protein
MGNDPRAFRPVPAQHLNFAPNSAEPNAVLAA